MRIKALERHPRKERVRILFEGDEEGGTELALDLVQRAGLAAGDTLEPEELEALVREDQTFRARDGALLLLSHRARSTEELRRRLIRKDFDRAVVERTLHAMADLGYLDDRAFAESFVRDRLRLRPRGRVGLLRELQRKGIDAGVAEAALATVMREETADEQSLAMDAAEAWGRRNRSVLDRASRSHEDRSRARRRLYSHLARRGFTPEAVRAAVDALLND